MATLLVKKTDEFSVNATVRESDKYTESVLVKFTRSYTPEDDTGCSEMFLTPAQLENLGMFLVGQASEIRAEQSLRKIK
jgi:hypothetical protein